MPCARAAAPPAMEDEVPIQERALVSAVGVAMVLPWVLIAVGCWLGVLLMRQSGRILLRLEAIELQLARLAADAEALKRAPAASGAMASAPVTPPALPVGTNAPAFEGPLLSGGRLSLADYRGRRVLLIFFNPQCGYCVQMAPALAALRVDSTGGTAGAGRRPVPLVVTSGDLEANRRFVAEHQIRVPVVLQRETEVAQAYGAYGTPMGYLVDEAGRIASPLTVGAEALLALDAATKPASIDGTGSGVDHNHGNGNGNGHWHGQQQEPQPFKGRRPLSESRLTREGLRAGTTAPGFRLPLVDAPGELALDDLRGRLVLLVFSDPHCGPCMALVPELEALHRRTPELEVLVVSRGDPEENRQKVASAGLTFPVVLQKQWEVSRDYGIFATPVGYLVDGAGTLISDVATGAEAILALGARAASLGLTTEGHARME